MSALHELTRLPERLGFPWLVLFRAGSLALSWPQLGISLLAVAVFWSGTAAIGRWFPHETPDRAPTELIRIVTDDTPAADEHPEHRLAATRLEPTWFDRKSPDPLLVLIAPWRSLGEPLLRSIASDGYVQVSTAQSAVRAGDLIVTLLFAAAVWSLFGAAICRASGVQLARERGESLPQVARYAAGRWRSVMAAPAIPAGAILGIVLGLLVAAWFGRLPWIGGPLLTAASPLVFLAGLAVAFLALVIVLGWPLMIAAMGVEDCDGFGALSRAYSFLTGRPALAAWNAFVSAVYGTVLVGLVGGLFAIALLAESGPIAAGVGNGERWSAVMHGSHLTAQFLLATFAVSLFWSLCTVNYLLLRQAVDGKPLDEIADPWDQAFRRDLPIVGISATDYRPGESDGQPKLAEAEWAVPAT